MFLLAVPVMVLLLAAGPVLLPERRVPGAGLPDAPSVLLSLGAVLPIVYGLKLMAEAGPGPRPLLAVLAGAPAAVWFVRRQRAVPVPVLDVRLFANRTFTAALLVLLLGMVALNGTEYFLAQYLQLVQGLSPLRAGLWIVPPALAIIAGSLLAPLLARRVPPTRVIAGGLGLAAAGFLLITQVGTGPGLAHVTAGFVVAFLGLSPTMALGMDLIVGGVPEERAGSASALGETGGELGMAFGFALLGSVGTVVYRTAMAGRAPADAPPDAVRAAEHTIAGAADLAARLPGPAGADLLRSAREAFTAGLNTVAGISAALVIALAVLLAAASVRTGRAARRDGAPARPARSR